MHKYLDHHKHPIANLVNYMTCAGRHAKFLGFLPINAKLDYWGIRFDDGGAAYCAVHLYEYCSHFMSEEEKREKKDIDAGKQTVLVFYGTDNTSYIRRFDSVTRAMKWFEKAEEVDPDDCMWRNS